MSNLELTNISGNAVLRDSVSTWRWYDAWGPNVLKYSLNPAALAVDDTTHDPTPEWTCTIVEGAGASTIGVTDVAGGAVIINTGTNENDGFKMQLGHAAGGVGENVSFAGKYPTYFGVKLQVSDATHTDFLAGFCVTDTACLDAVADGLYFRSVDESAVAYIVLEQDSAESTTAVATMVAATDILLEFFYWGSSVYVYADSVLMATIADTDANFCNDELLRLTFEFLTGEANTNTCTIKMLRFIQIQA